MYKIKTLLLILATLGMATLASGAGVPHKLTSDSIELGRPTSTDDKDILFNTGDGAGNTKIVVDDANQDLSITADKLKVGDGTDTNKIIEADNGDANPPQLRYNASTSKWQRSDDGLIFEGIGSGAGGGGVNILANPDFESGVNDWTPTGGSTFVVGGSLFGSQSGTWDASASGEFLSSDVITIPTGLHGNICVVQSFYSWDAGSAGHIKIQAFDGTNVLIEQDLLVTSGGITKESFLVFTCPTSGTLQVRYESTADAAALIIDRQHLGSNIREVQVNAEEYTFLGSLTTTGSWSTNTTYAAVYWRDKDFLVANILVDLAGAPDAVALTINLPAGHTIDNSKINFDNDTISHLDGTVNIRDDGVSTNTGKVQIDSAATTSVSIVDQDTASVTTQSVNQTTPITFGASDALTITYRVPIVEFTDIATTNVISFSQADWHIDLNIGGGNPSLGSAAVSTYTEIIDAGLDMVLNTGSHAAEIPCSGTNPSTGLTCSAGSESVGAVFTPPFAGKFEVCGSFKDHINCNGAANCGFHTFQWIETPNNAQTILQEGGDRTGGGIQVSDSDITTPNQNCGTFTFSNVQQKTLRLMYEQSVSGTGPTASTIFLDREALNGQRDMKITVRPITQFKGGIRFDNLPETANKAGEKVATFTLDWQGTGVPIVGEDAGSIVDTLVDEGVGDVTVNFVAGTWVNPPQCGCSARDNISNFCNTLTTPPVVGSSRFRFWASSTGTTVDPATGGEGMIIRCEMQK